MEYKLVGEMRWKAKGRPALLNDPKQSRPVGDERSLPIHETIEAENVTVAQLRAQATMKALYKQHKPDVISATLSQIICTFTGKPTPTTPTATPQEVTWTHSLNL